MDTKKHLLVVARGAVSRSGTCTGQAECRSGNLVTRTDRQSNDYDGCLSVIPG
jgi:hypothetical protein